MNLAGEFAISCEVCGQLVSAVDVQPRKDPRGFHKLAGNALLCARCAWIVDHIPRSLGPDPFSALISVPADPGARGRSTNR